MEIVKRILGKNNYIVRFNDTSEIDLVNNGELGISCGVIEINYVGEFISFLKRKGLSPREIVDEIILAVKEVTYLNHVVISIVRSPVRMVVSTILAGRKGVTVSEWKRNP